MIKVTAFQNRLKRSSRRKNSRIVLSLDPITKPDLKKFAINSIYQLQQHICAIKINLHLILPLSKSDLAEINRLAHSYSLQSIADIKLNDIPNTNYIAIKHLLEMGFDAVIMNPLIGKLALKSSVRQTHEKSCGVIALTYMSHPGAKECYGAEVLTLRTSKSISMARMFLATAVDAGVDGIVIGATQPSILGEISPIVRIPIFSPGIGAQGGMINGRLSDYFIVGRSIIASADPIKEARKFQLLAK